MFAIHSIEAIRFLELNAFYVSEDLANKADSYIKINLAELGKRLNDPQSTDSHINAVIYATNDTGKIVGFRYYYYKHGSFFCKMFATFVDEAYRCRGLAKIMILKSFSDAKEKRCTEFEILLTEPNEEKEGLFKFYCNYALSNQDECKFTVNYWTQIKRFGYVS